MKLICPENGKFKNMASLEYQPQNANDPFLEVGNSPFII